MVCLAWALNGCELMQAACCLHLWHLTTHGHPLIMDLLLGYRQGRQHQTQLKRNGFLQTLLFSTSAKRLSGVLHTPGVNPTSFLYAVMHAGVASGKYNMGRSGIEFQASKRLCMLHASFVAVGQSSPIVFAQGAMYCALDIF